MVILLSQEPLEEVHIVAMVPIWSCHTPHIRIRSHEPLRRTIKVGMLRIRRHTDEQPLRLPIVVRAKVGVRRDVVRIPPLSGLLVDNGPPTIPITLGSMVENQIVKIPKNSDRAREIDEVTHPSKSDYVPHRFGCELGQTNVVRHQKLGYERIQRKAETILQMVSIHGNEPPRWMSHPRTLLFRKLAPVPQGMLNSV
jgi:hypothetical protein